MLFYFVFHFQLIHLSDIDQFCGKSFEIKMIINQINKIKMKRGNNRAVN